MSRKPKPYLASVKLTDQEREEVIAYEVRIQDLDEGDLNEEVTRLGDCLGSAHGNRRIILNEMLMAVRGRLSYLGVIVDCSK